MSRTQCFWKRAYGTQRSMTLVYHCAIHLSSMSCISAAKAIFASALRRLNDKMNTNKVDTQKNCFKQKTAAFALSAVCLFCVCVLVGRWNPVWWTCYFIDFIREAIRIQYVRQCEMRFSRNIRDRNHMLNMIPRAVVLLKQFAVLSDFNMRQ